MKKIVKFSKSYKNIYSLKTNFYQDNKTNYENAIKLNKIYLKGKKRKYCKNCNYKIKNFFLKSFGVRYSICSKCGHLNGEKLEDKNFFKKLYVQTSGSKNIVKNYKNDFKKRVKLIYNDKVKFLKKVIKQKINVLDVGAGAGHFLKALENHNIFATGIEPNEFLRDIGASFLKKNVLHKKKLEELKSVILKEKKANCLSAIGVMEHLEDPQNFLKSFQNSSIKYLYISVPLFSLTSFVENSFQKVYPRHLSGGHTHLYTKESLYFIAEKFNLKIVGEWWFGTDIADFYRSLIINSYKVDKKIYKKLLDKNLYSILNELQNVIDRNKICSEVHMIFSK